MGEIEWCDPYELGFPELDRDHCRLMDKAILAANLLRLADEAKAADDYDTVADIMERIGRLDGFFREPIEITFAPGSIDHDNIGSALRALQIIVAKRRHTQTDLWIVE